jgi:galactokinase/mevalonate kinase-like predicted kinase
MAARNTNVALHSNGFHSQGLSHSSREHLLDEAEWWHRTYARPIAIGDVAQRALARERNDSSIAIAAQDVYSIAYGGVVGIATRADGGITVDPIQYDRNWIAEYVAIGVKLDGERHDSPTLLRDLVDHPQARRYVRYITLEAALAADAIRHADPFALAAAVNEYRRWFDEWSGHRYVSPVVTNLAQSMERTLGKDAVLGWKLPGAGGCSSIMVITADIDAVARQLESAAWLFMPALVTGGLRCEQLAEEGLVRISAGYRIDFVGAADLGQDPRIGEDGLCVSAAIKPREMRMFAAPLPEEQNTSSLR